VKLFFFDRHKDGLVAILLTNFMLKHMS